MRALSGDLGVNEIVRLLGMQAHPEGGWYVETFRDSDTGLDGRARSTAIYYLLAADQVSVWHRIDAVETWHWYAGGPMVLTLSPPDGKGARVHHLGPDLRGGQRPQCVVPAHHWQTAESLGAWTLVGCTVAPGFRFEGFELAPEDWRPEV